MYDEAGHLLGEYFANGTRVQEYVWLDDQLVAVLSDHDASTYQFVETDHLGTPRAVIHPVENNIVWRWNITNTAFGEHAASNNPDADAVTYTFNLRYPGQMYDAESVLHYNYFRDGYEPGVGRYTQSDPIGLTGGVSTYGYVVSSPFNNIDPQGLQQTQPIFTPQPSPISPNMMPPGSGFGPAANGPSINPGAVGGVGATCSAVVAGILASVMPGNIFDGNRGGCSDDPGHKRSECRGPCDELNAQVQAMKRVVESVGACRQGMSRYQLQVRYVAWLNLAAARARRDQVCWGGGDPGHQQAQADAWANTGTCGRMLGR